MNPSLINNLVNLFAKFNLFDNGYTIYNTILFSIIGIFVYFFIAHFYLKHKKQKINLRFINLTIVFALIGAILRMFSQNYSSIGGVIEFSKNPLNLGFYFVYPNLFILLAVLFFVLYELSLFVSKKFNVSRLRLIETVSYFSLFLLLIYVFINMTYFSCFIKTLGLSLLVFSAIFLAFYLFKPSLLRPRENKLIVYSQVLDSVSSICALSAFPVIFKESHILSSIVISQNAFLFIVFKILLAFVLIILINKFVRSENENRYFKLFVIILGFSTGFRNLLTIGLLFV